jgi:hypothetical protein
MQGNHGPPAVKSGFAAGLMGAKLANSVSKKFTAGTACLPFAASAATSASNFPTKGPVAWVARADSGRASQGLKGQ